MNSTAPVARRTVERVRQTLLDMAAKLRNSRLARASAVTVVLNSGAVLISGVTALLLARLLGPTAYGHVVLFTTAVLLISLLADVGGVFFANTFLIATKDHPDMAIVRGSLLAYGFAVGVAVGTLFLLAPVRRAVSEEFNSGAWGFLLLGAIAGQVVWRQVSSYYSGVHRFGIVGVIAIAPVALYAIGAAIAVVGFGGGARTVATAQAAAHLVVAGICAAVFARAGMSPPQAEYLRRCAQFGWKAAVINVLSLLHTRVDQILISHFLGAAAVGVYGTAVALGEMLTRVPGMVGAVLFPIVAADSGPAASRRTFRLTASVMATVGAASLLIWWQAPWLLTFLFGRSFGSAIWPLRLLLPAAICLAGLVTINNHLAGLGYPNILLKSMVAGLSLNIVINVMLLPRVGVVGASIASSITYLLQLVIVIRYLMRWHAREVTV